MLFRQMRILVSVSSQPLWIDVDGYKSIAAAMKHPFDTDVREPVLIWIYKMTAWLLGPSDLSIHLMGSVFFAATAFLYFFLIQNLSKSFWVALLAFFLFANSTFALELFAGGIRDSFFISAILLFCFFGFTDFEWLTPPLRIAGLTLGCIWAMGTRITIYPFLLFFLFFVMKKNKGGLAYFIFPILGLLVFIGPYLWVSYQNYGDAFYSANIHAICWRNWEFNGIRGTGCPGCPDPILEPGMYAGEKTTWFKYLFVLHPFKQLVSDSLIGFGDLFIFRTQLSRVMSNAHFLVLYPFYLLGLGLVLYSRHRVLLLFPFFLCAGLLFTVPLKMDPRLFSSALPFLTACTAYGVYFVAKKIGETEFWKERIFLREASI